MHGLKNRIYELIFLLLISTGMTAVGFLLLIQKPAEAETEPEPVCFTPIDMRDDLPDLAYTKPEPVYPEVIEKNLGIRRTLGEIIIQRTRIIKRAEHRMFITAYCSEECGGSTTTSSGATCHREEEPHRPTTAAIDRRYFRYGDLFYVPSEDRIYIAEDTGSGVRGMWLDTYQNSMDAVRRYNTRYETVYEIEIEEYPVLASNYDIREQIAYYSFAKRGGSNG